MGGRARADIQNVGDGPPHRGRMGAEAATSTIDTLPSALAPEHHAGRLVIVWDDGRPTRWRVW
jgi:hypothetical protein